MKTYNTVVTSKEVKTLENAVARAPYECIELSEGRFGFMDNERGDIRNYFADTLGYECSNYEAFDFEYFDEPQSVEPNKPNFYTQNGWQGSKYDSKKGAKEVAKELRAYIKANPDLNACKWSIRSKWGTVADYLYISLMAAPFDPFTDEYKTRYEYRYNRGYSEHGDTEEYTTSEAYKLIQKVKSFVMQYIYDDSDGMIDYFDRNIYDHYEIGQYYKPFQIIENKGSKKQNGPAGEPNEGKAPETVSVPEGLEIVDYSEKAIAVFGDTKAIKEELKKLGGRFNPYLNHNVEKRSGWIFSKKQADKVRALLAPASDPSESVTLPEPPKEIDITDVLDEPEADTTPLIIPDFEKFGCADFSSVSDELDGFKLGEVAFDQFGEIGVILAFYDMGEVRLTSNGVCNIGNLRKCPKDIAEKEVAHMEVIRPGKDMSENRAGRDIKIFEQNDNFYRIVKRLRDNIKKGHTESTVKKNIKSLYELVHDEFFRTVTVPYFSKHPSINKIDNGVVTEFLRRADKLAKGDNVENDLSGISRFSSIYCTCEEISKEINERSEFAKASKTFIQEWRENNPYPGSEHLEEFNAKFNREYSEFVEKWAKDNGTQINSYLFPDPYPIERGEYKETELDRQKKEADILVESIDGNWYTIRLNREIEIKSKRIRNYDNGCIAVGHIQNLYNLRNRPHIIYIIECGIIYISLLLANYAYVFFIVECLFYQCQRGSASHKYGQSYTRKERHVAQRKYR